MKLRLDHLGSPKEWISLGVGLIIVGALYGTLIHPALKMVAQLNSSQVEKQAAQEELNRTQRTLLQLREQIAAQTTRLETLGGAPPPASQKDLLIARLAGMADACGITVDQYTPIDTIRASDHRAFFVQFTGRGSYAAIQDYFGRVETEIDFVDVTHWTITAEAGPDQPVCLVNWSCRINALINDEIARPQHVGRPPGRQDILEVARHGN